MPNLAIINGELLPEEQATVPVLDRGFLFGDSVYEVVRTRGGIPFLLEPHYERLQASADRLGMRLSLSLDELRRQLRRGLAATGYAEHYVRVVVTRGWGPPNISPKVAEGHLWVLLFRELGVPTPEQYERGLSAAIPGVCRNHPQALDPAIKSGNYLNNILALKEAQDRGAEEALILNRDGNLTEATTANVFIVEGDRIVTPPLAEGILSGITRSYILRLAAAEKVDIREEHIPLARLLAAGEVFITSSTRDILAVTTLEGRPVGDGTAGPVTRDLMARFARAARATHEEERRTWEG